MVVPVERIEVEVDHTGMAEEDSDIRERRFHQDNGGKKRLARRIFATGSFVKRHMPR